MTSKPYAPRSIIKFKATHTYVGQAPQVYFSLMHHKSTQLNKIGTPKTYGNVPVWQYTGWHHKKKNYKQLEQEAKQNG